MVIESQLNPPKNAIAGMNFSIFCTAAFSRKWFKNSMIVRYKIIGEPVMEHVGILYATHATKN